MKTRRYLFDVSHTLEDASGPRECLVEIDDDYLKRLRRIREVMHKVAEDPHFCEITFWDAEAKWVENTPDSPEEGETPPETRSIGEQLGRDDPGPKETLLGELWERIDFEKEINYSLARTDCDQLHADKEGVRWSARPGHCDWDMETSGSLSWNEILNPRTQG